MEKRNVNEKDFLFIFVFYHVLHISLKQYFLVLCHETENVPKVLKIKCRQSVVEKWNPKTLGAVSGRERPSLPRIIVKWLLAVRWLTVISANQNGIKVVTTGYSNDRGTLTESVAYLNTSLPWCNCFIFWRNAWCVLQMKLRYTVG